MTSEENKANNYDGDIGSQLKSACEENEMSVPEAVLLTGSNDADIDIDIGSRLRNAREAQGMSISEAAELTGFDDDMIENLEANRFSEFGASVFARGYLGLYALRLNLNHTEITKLFDRLNTNPALESGSSDQMIN